MVVVGIIIGVVIFIVLVAAALEVERSGSLETQRKGTQRKGIYRLSFMYAPWDLPHLFPAQNCVVTFEVVELERSSNGSMSRVKYGNAWGASQQARNYARNSLAPLWVSTNQIQWLTGPEEKEGKGRATLAQHEVAAHEKD